MNGYVRVQRLVEEDQMLKTMLILGQWLVAKDIRQFSVSFLCRFAPRPKISSRKAREICEMMGDLQWVVAIPPPLGGRAVQFAVNPRLGHCLKIDKIDTPKAGVSKK